MSAPVEIPESRRGPEASSRARSAAPFRAKSRFMNDANIGTPHFMNEKIGIYSRFMYVLRSRSVENPCYPRPPCEARTAPPQLFFQTRVMDPLGATVWGEH